MRDGNGQKCEMKTAKNAVRSFLALNLVWFGLNWGYISPDDQHGIYLFLASMDSQHWPKCVAKRVLGGIYASFKKSVVTVYIIPLFLPCFGPFLLSHIYLAFSTSLLFASGLQIIQFLFLTLNPLLGFTYRTSLEWPPVVHPFARQDTRFEGVLVGRIQTIHMFGFR
jgi:hypothetical protein